MADIQLKYFFVRAAGDQAVDATQGGHPVVDLAEMLSKLGSVCSILRNYAAAIDAYREALTMNPLMEGPKEALEELERLEQAI